MPGKTTKVNAGSLFRGAQEKKTKQNSRNWLPLHGLSSSRRNFDCGSGSGRIPVKLNMFGSPVGDLTCNCKMKRHPLKEAGCL